MLLELPLNVGVAPTFAPDDDSTVTLCISAAMFVKSIVTAPAFAVSALVLYSSLPSGFASRLTLLDALVPLLAGVEAVVDAVVDAVEAVVAGGLVVLAALLVEELEDELPQPASTAARSASVDTASTKRLRFD
jgi:hypothetical protein